MLWNNCLLLFFTVKEFFKNEGAIILAARVEHLVQQKEYHAALEICKKFFQFNELIVDNDNEHVQWLKDLSIIASWFVDYPSVHFTQKVNMIVEPFFIYILNLSEFKFKCI